MLLKYCFLSQKGLNPLLNNKMFNVTQLIAFVDDKLNVAKMAISLLDRVENTMAKGENSGYQHFLLFQRCFPKHSSLGSLKFKIMW